jgi:hypothetical protein
MDIGTIILSTQEDVIMGRRRKKNTKVAEALVWLIFSAVYTMVMIVTRLILLVYDQITFHTSGYGRKSGNGFLKTIFDKGIYGEMRVYRKVIRIFGKDAVMTNVYLDGKNTETTEIDVIAVSTKGVYVFEVKNYGGYIYGSEKDEYWTQAFNKHSKHKFYNPLRQNYAHTKAVEKHLGLVPEAIVPLVVFSDRSKLAKLSLSSKSNVFQTTDAMRFVRRTEKKGPQRITEEEKKQSIVKLIERSNMPEDVKMKHIQDVRNMVGETI